MSNTQQILGTLKDFQLASVEHVHARLWDPEAPSRRFLLADEVGLGKTLVARGVIAKTADHLVAQGRRKVQVVYICSNAQIATQNLGKLNIEEGPPIEHADRLTMLPTTLKDLDEKRVNFISFTPGTSFEVEGSGGKATERVVLYWLLAACWSKETMRSACWASFFTGAAQLKGFQDKLESFDQSSLPAEFVASFSAVLEAAVDDQGRDLREALDECSRQFLYLRGKPGPDLSRRRYTLIGMLRRLVAAAAVKALEPDLIILDEFQRFKTLLTPGTPSADLAHVLFDDPNARVLLLSATPYKMYTLPDEPDGEDHYADFVATYRFLAGDSEARELEHHLMVLRDSLVGARDRAEGETAKAEVQARLRRVMCRTERTSSGGISNAMLEERPLGALTLVATDLRGWLTAERVATALAEDGKSPMDLFEYWRSTPYLLNLMDKYKIKQRLADRMGVADQELTAALEGHTNLLKWDEVRSYRALDPGNAKMRALVEDVMVRQMWRLPWLPPTLPSWTLTGTFGDQKVREFTKRLIFSSWAVVPKAIGIVLSFEAERRMRVAASRYDSSYDDRRPSQLLTFSTSDGRPSGMPALGLLYPSPTLAALGDPLRIARETGQYLPLDRAALEVSVEAAVSELLRQLPARAEGAESGPADQRWYWFAPLHLDRQVPGQEAFLAGFDSWSHAEDDGGRGFADHVAHARALQLDELGRMPEDLTRVLTEVALASPGNCALRALSRVCGGPDSLADIEIREYASWVSWGLRSLFNRPEVIHMLRADESAAYWRMVLAQCLDGCLSAVLDEYFHVLVESEGLQPRGPHLRAYRLAEVFEQATQLRAVNNPWDELVVEDAGVVARQQRMRVHFALRFGRDESEDSAVQREKQLRTAFNSPFWPFVLASTSVGQEGLDFHTYSHAVVHWNLPGNPVDLEQREGRVHRYKGHAVRKNVAAAHAGELTLCGDDMWAELFQLAVDARHPDASDLIPYWLYATDGGARIERYVPAMPLSRETARHKRLLRTTGAYRLVLGQPRQEDLLAYVGDTSGLDWATIDLRPAKSSRKG